MHVHLSCLTIKSYFCIIMSTQVNNPLHGKTLESILNELVAYYGWPELGRRIRINCFTADPSVSSSLKFLRKTPWARTKVEDLYVQTKF
jgi:uncharacterized protein (DUF2132 family)